MLSPDQIAQYKAGMGIGTSGASNSAPATSDWVDSLQDNDDSQQKTGSGLGGFVKSIVSAPATMIARPFQALESVGEKLGTDTSGLQAQKNQSDQTTLQLQKLIETKKSQGEDTSHLEKTLSDIQAQPDYLGNEISAENNYKPASGGIVADAPENLSDVKKDVGRGIETAALGAGGPVLGGAAFGLGNSLEQGNNLFSPTTAVDTILGGVGGKALDIVGKPVFNAVGKVAAKITPELIQDISSKGVSAIQDFAKSHNILPEQVSHVINSANDTATKLVDGSVDSITNKITNKAVDTGKNIVGATPEKAISSATKDWENPATINKPGYSKAKDILSESKSKGLNPAKFLAEQGINPELHIEGGNFSTSDTADKLRNTATKLSNDSLRPSLEIANHSTEKVPVSDLIERTIKDIKNSKGVTPGDVASQVNKAKEEGLALQDKFPDGMNLTNLHDNKITYAQNGKYSPIGDTNVNNTSAVNRSFGRSLGKTLEENAPKDIPVGDFNKYLQQYHNAADYLDALNNKKAPVGIGKKVLRSVAKGAGAIVGAHLGGLPVEFAGYSIGGALEHAVENMPNPIKAHFLSNLQKTNPEAFKKVGEYLGKKEMEKLMILKLPAPNPIGSAKNPIITPAPTTYEKMVPRGA